MKHRPFNELTKHWPPERTAKVEARVDTALAELDRQESEQAADKGPTQAVTGKAHAGSVTTHAIASKPLNDA